MSDPMSRLNGALRGRYRVERQLGEGGMATVYLAEDERHGRKVALKVLKPDLAAAVGAERFLAEIKTTANLHHPHVLPLHDSGAADGLLFYVMPHVDGESLRERMSREGQLGVDEAIRIAATIASGLDYAHRQGVVHRDIKPSNILLQDGEPVIADFGIALATRGSGEERLTGTGTSIGTPHYMSPEQASGDTDVGPATDIYSLGSVLYEMLVGEPPFAARTRQAALANVLTQPPPSAAELRPSTPNHVDAAIARALAKSASDRFPSASAFADALLQAPTSSVGGPHSSSRWSEWRMAGVGAVLVTLVGAWVVASLIGGGDENAENLVEVPVAPAPAETTVLVLPPVDETGAPEFASLPDRLADGIRRSIAQTGEVRTTERIASNDLAASDRRGSAEIVSRSLATRAIAGSVFLVGDSLHLTMEVVDESAETIRILDELAVERGSANVLVGLAADQAAAAVLDLTFGDGHEFRYWSLPKKAEAMRLYAQASVAFGETRYRDATDLLEGAIEVEPDWPRPYWVLRQATELAGRRDEVWGRYEAGFQAVSDRLSPDERMYIRWQRAPSRTERLEVAEQRFRLASGGSTTGYQLAAAALSLNRLELALEGIEAQDFDHLEIAVWPNAWVNRAQVYHYLGDWEQELTTAREARRRMPNRFWFRFIESRALLALDRDEEALAVFSTLTDIATSAQDLDPATETRRLWNAMHEGTFEFRLHGSPEIEREALEVFEAWVRSRQDLSRWQTAQTHYRFGRYQEAIPLLRDELAETDGVFRLPPGALLAISLHALGDSDGADAVEAELTYPPGDTNWRRQWLALAAAGRGDPDRALRILVEAFADGVPFYPGGEDFFHFRPEFEELRRDPRFQQLAEPRTN